MILKEKESIVFEISEWVLTKEKPMFLQKKKKTLANAKQK